MTSIVYIFSFFVYFLMAVSLAAPTDAITVIPAVQIENSNTIASVYEDQYDRCVLRVNSWITGHRYAPELGQYIHCQSKGTTVESSLVETRVANIKFPIIWRSGSLSRKLQEGKLCYYFNYIANFEKNQTLSSCL